MPFIWVNTPQFPNPVPPFIIPSNAVSAKVDVVANAVNIGGTLLYNTANVGYDIVYPVTANSVNTSITSINIALSNSYATMVFVNTSIAAAIANASGGGGFSFSTINLHNRHIATQNSIVANSSNDTLNVIAGRGITTWSNSENNGITLESIRTSAIYVSENSAIIAANVWTPSAVQSSGSVGAHAVVWCEELGLFVGLLRNGIAVTSPDGTNWTTQNAPVYGNAGELGYYLQTTPQSYRALAYSPQLGLFVAVGATSFSANQVLTSSDAINWTAQAITSNSAWYDVCWAQELGLFVAVGACFSTITRQSVWTSPNGLTWTQRTAATGDNWMSVCWSSELSLLVSVSSSSTNTSNNRVMTSSDAVTWTQRPSPNFLVPSSNVKLDWADVCWASGLGLFVAAGGLVRTWDADPSAGLAWRSNAQTIMTSADGLTWTRHEEMNGPQTDPDDNPWMIGSAIIWCSQQNKLVVVGGITVSDGLTSHPYSVGISSDSFTWTYYNLGNPPEGGLDTPYDVAYSPSLNKFVLVSDSTYPAGQGGRRFLTSETGVSWTRNTIPFVPSVWTTPVWSPELGIFVSVSISGGAIAGQPQQPLISSKISTDGKEWTRYSSTTTGNTVVLFWSTPIWAPELGLFVTVAGTSTTAYNGNKVATSPDGVSWTIQTTPTTPVQAANCNWSSVTWSPELSSFLALGFHVGNTRCQIMTSPNAQVWTANSTSLQSAFASPSIFSIWAPEINKFVAMVHTTDNANSVMSSTNGTDWTVHATPNTQYWTSVAWSPDLRLFAAITANVLTQSEAPFFYAQNIIKTSSNGVTWTEQTTPGWGNGFWDSIVWSHEMQAFIAVGYVGDEDYATGLISIDGIHWTQHNTHSSIAATHQMFLGSGVGGDVVWSPELGIFVGGGTQVTWRSSPVGIWRTFTRELEELDNLNAYNTIRVDGQSDVVASQNHTLGVIAGNSVILRTDSNLKSVTISVPYIEVTETAANVAVNTWITQTSALDSFKTVAWSPELGLFVALTDAGTGLMMTSINGQDWVSRTINTRSWSGIVWSPELGLFAAVSREGTATGVMTSPDGVTWTLHTTPTNFWNAITWAPELGIFVAVSGCCGSERVITSRDGITWTPSTTPIQTWNGVTWSPELRLFVAVGTSGTYQSMTSPDGVTWTLGTLTHHCNDVVWSPELGIFVAAGENGSVLTSTDGVTWISRYISAYSWTSIAWSPELHVFAVVSDGGGGTDVLTSRDGLTWEPRYTGLVERDVTWSPELGLFVAVGSNVMTSSLVREWRTNRNTLSNTSPINYDPANGRYSHANSGVTATKYGNTTFIPQITVDARGHVTNVTNVALTSAVSSVAGKTGAVLLNTFDIAENTSSNLWFTAARVRGNVSNTTPINYNSTTGVFSHADSGVAATSHGNSTTIPVFIVNATGHVTSVTNTAIAGLDTSVLTTGTLGVTRGGTGQTAASLVNGAVLIGNTVSGGYDLNTLTQGTGIVITNDKGSITIAASGASAIDQYARDKANGAAQNAFSTLRVTGQNDVIADSNVDILTLVAGTGMVITTDDTTDTITFTATGGSGTVDNSFTTIAVTGQSNIVADSNNDTLTIVGSGITILTDAGTDTLTIQHPASGVTPSGYGTASAVPVFVVDANGHITSVTNTSIAISATQITSGTLAVARGGTGQTAITVNGCLLIGNTVSGGFDVNPITATTPIVIANGQGSIVLSHATSGVVAAQHGTAAIVPVITVNDTGHVTAVTNTTIAITTSQVSESAGGPFFHTTARVRGNVSNTTPINYEPATGVFSHADSGVVATGHGDGATVPKIVVNATGHVTAVTNTAIAISAAAITSGTLAVSRGGTGQTAITVNGSLLIGNTVSGGFDVNPITQGTNITVTNDKGSITISSSDAFAQTQANAAYNRANAAYANANTAIYTAAQIRANVSNTAPIRYDASTGVISHADSGVVASGYGDAATIPVFVANASGHISSVTNTAIAISASQITSGTLAVGRGGTGQTAASLVNGAILLGNTVSGGYDLNTLTQGSGIVITNDKGSVTIAATGAAATDQYARDKANGAVQTGFTIFAVSGQSDIVPDSNTDTMTIVGSGITITTDAGSDTLTLTHPTSGVTATGHGDAATIPVFIVDARGHVTSVVNTAVAISAAAITSGTLAVARGGTGQTAITVNGAILIANTVSGGYDVNRITQGTGVLITNDKGSITIAANVVSVAGMTGAVTLETDDVTEAAGGPFYHTAARVRGNVSNTTPINYEPSTGVFSHATSGVTATGHGDAATIPTFVVNTTGHVTSVTNTAIAIATSQITSGILSVARGGTGKDATGIANGALLIGNTVNSGFDLTTVTQGAGVTVTNGKGTITISANGNPNTAAEGSVQFNRNGNLAGSTNLVWDNATTMLGIGHTPTDGRLHIQSRRNLDDVGISFFESTIRTEGPCDELPRLEVASYQMRWPVDAVPEGSEIVLSADSGTRTANANTLPGHSLGSIVARGVNRKPTSSDAARIRFTQAGNSSPQGVPGLIQFYTSDGSDDQAPERMRITQNGYVGIGTTAPSTDFEVVNDGGVEGFTGVAVTHYAGASLFADVEIYGRAAQGSEAVPSAILFEDVMIALAGSGYNGSTFTGNKGYLYFAASQNWSVANNGTYFSLATTANNTTTPQHRLLIRENGMTGVGNTAPRHSLSVNGNTWIQNELISQGAVSVGTPGEEPSGYMLGVQTPGTDDGLYLYNASSNANNQSVGIYFHVDNDAFPKAIANYYGTHIEAVKVNRPYPGAHALTFHTNSGGGLDSANVGIRIWIEPHGSIGIANTLPKHNISVSGNAWIRDGITVRGAFNNEGGPGTANQILLSNGAGTVWTTLANANNITITHTAGTVTLDTSGLNHAQVMSRISLGF